MAFRLSPLWWPVLVAASPALIPWALIRNRRFEKDHIQAAEVNQRRISRAELLEMPELDFLELKVLVEGEAGGLHGVRPPND